MRCSNFMQYPRLSSLRVHTAADSFSVSPKRLNVNSYELSESEGMLRAVGSQHSLVWLFVPYWGPFISNAGSSFNEIPLFIFDGSCERAIKVASGRYEAFLAGLMSKASECKEDIVLEAERWETENGGKKETWKPREIDDMVSLEDEDSKWKGGILPVGWESVPSRSRPGEISYYHRPSGQSQRRHPLDPHFLKQQRKLKAEKSFVTVMRRRLMSKLTSSRSPKGRRNARGDGDAATVATLASSVVTRRQTGSSSLPPGWIRTPSRSRPDITVYLHVKTGARSPNLPTVATQQALIQQWKQENPKDARREAARGNVERPMPAPPTPRHHRDNEEGLQREDATFARSANNSATRSYRNDFAASSRSPKGGRNARGDGTSVATSPQKGSSSLPPGWIRTPSRSNPDAIVYLHVKTGARSTKFPTAERQRVMLNHFKKEHIRKRGLNPCEDVRPVESTVRFAEGGRRGNAESTWRADKTALSSPNNTITSSRTVVTFGDTEVLNDETFTDNPSSQELQPMQSTPISDWLKPSGKSTERNLDLYLLREMWRL